MHDPSDATKDEENQTTTVTDTNDAKEAMKDDEERNNETGADQAMESTTGTAVVAESSVDSMTDTKPEAMEVDEKKDDGDNDESMDDAEDEEENTNDNKNKNKNNNGNNAHKDEKKDNKNNNSDDNGNNKHTTTTTGSKNNGQGSRKGFNTGGKAETTKQGQPQTATPTNGGSSASAGPPAAAPPPPPVLKGTLSYNVENRRHMIRGMWNYENSSTFPPQRFELLRSLEKDDDLTDLTQDGEFHGSFSLAYFHTTSKGKQKERSKVISESGVKIKFTPIEGKEGDFDVDGEGTNQFGIFNINGTATPSEHEGDPTYDIVLRKRYKPASQIGGGGAVAAAGGGAAAFGAAGGGQKKKKRKSNAIGGLAGATTEAADVDLGPLPPPAESFPSRVVCLRGKLIREESDELGVDEVVHRINGMWSSGLDLILADPLNVRGLCNKFEYEHKSTLPNNTFPVSGRYSGWFDLTNEDGSRTRINEKDITLKFRRNNAGYHNVEGKGSNAFGKYTISGTLSQEHIITIFRHFQARKPKPKDVAAAKATSSAVAPVAVKQKAPVVPLPEPKLSLDDIVIPGGDKTDGTLEAIPPPQHGTYSAISRGIMRLNDDGAHTCSGKWAMTREHFNNGTVSNFAFRLESHFAAQGAAAMKKANGEDTTTMEEDEGVSLSGAPPGSMTFPVDAHMYKGSFQMKRGATKYTSVIDQQIVLKFRKNTEGSFNVYGTGLNSIGTFTLIGKLILSGKSSGHVELYRMYPLPPPAPAQPGQAAKATAAPSKTPAPFLPKSAAVHKPVAEKSSVSLPSMLPKQSLQRRESSRLVKLPSRLEDDDPSAQINRLLDKCAQVLKVIREKDVATGAFFGQPVDPVAHGIPTYYTIVSEPMDLGSIQGKMDASEIPTPEEFGRLVRLVFENAMTFNIETTHVVHQSARQLLILFNQKIRDIERMAENVRRQHNLPDAVQGDPLKAKQAKGKNKRKGAPEEEKSPKRRRLEEAQGMAAANANALAALAASAPPASTGSVSRTEFNMMIQMIQKLQNQVVQTFTVVANMSSDDVDDHMAAPVVPAPMMDALPPYVAPPAAILPPIVPERKKPAPKRKEEKAPAIDEDKPLTFEEQQQLTETINTLPPEKLPGVIKIIRESGTFGDDEEEIDLEIDQLDTVTQRKLQHFVMKNVKAPRGRKAGKAAPKKKPPAKKAEPKPKPLPVVPKKQPSPKPANHGSFFAFGAKDDDSDSDSEGEIKAEDEGKASEPVKNEFSLTDGFADANDDDEDNDDAEDGGFGGNWDMSALSTSKPAAASAAKDDDDDWGAAREQAEVAKARDAERKAREEKMRAEAESAKNQRLVDAAARGEEVRAQREEEAANEALLREQKEKEAKDKKKDAREAARVELQAVEQTVDMDAQRDIMKKFENNYMGDEADGASPSSDFGF